MSAMRPGGAGGLVKRVSVRYRGQDSIDKGPQTSA